MSPVLWFTIFLSLTVSSLKNSQTPYLIWSHVIHSTSPFYLLYAMYGYFSYLFTDLLWFPTNGQWAPWEQGPFLPCSLSHPWHLAKYLVHSRNVLNICYITEWEDACIETINEKINLYFYVKPHFPKISNIEPLNQWVFSKIYLELDISSYQKLQMTYFFTSYNF